MRDVATNTVGAENVVGLTVKDAVEPEKTDAAVLDVEKEIGHEVVVTDHEVYPPPTEEERSTLRKVNDSIPIAAWSLCFVELAERAS